ncbi:MAG: hypothetical protein ABJJ92_10685, partial [Tateyamaria sp.]|uniref:hypothetical protein n=1 Tax=Tateyamaria sp. TaxID=1929288 RepID=UPI00329BDB10
IQIVRMRHPAARRWNGSTSAPGAPPVIVSNDPSDRLSLCEPALTPTARRWHGLRVSLGPGLRP